MSKGFDPKLSILYREGTEALQEGSYGIVCSECMKPLNFFGFSGGTGFWLCGCDYEEYRKQ